MNFGTNAKFCELEIGPLSKSVTLLSCNDISKAFEFYNQDNPLSFCGTI